MKSGKKFFEWLGYMHYGTGQLVSEERNSWPEWAKAAWKKGRYNAIFSPRKI